MSSVIAYPVAMMRAPFDSEENWQRYLELVRVPLLLAPGNFLAEIRNRLDEYGVRAAIRDRHTPVIYNWMISLVDRQGVSNRAAIAFRESHGGATWGDLAEIIEARPICSKLRSYWHYADCGYKKSRETCARSDLMPLCPVPSIPARKGLLSQAAVSLALFIRDVCDGDLVRWIDDRLACADTGNDANRALCMRVAVLEPLINVTGTGPKVWSMILAELLLAGDGDRERWVTTGASLIAIDTLVHAYLHRIGILRRFAAEHAYGPACYGKNGCTAIIEQLSKRIDAREYNPTFPMQFPRFVQFALWLFCSESGWSICNGNNGVDRSRCMQGFCPSFAACDRVPLSP